MNAPTIELDTIEKIVALLRLRNDPELAAMRAHSPDVAKFEKFSDHQLVRHLIHAAVGLLDAFPEEPS